MYIKFVNTKKKRSNQIFLIFRDSKYKSNTYTHKDVHKCVWVCIYPSVI